MNGLTVGMCGPIRPIIRYFRIIDPYSLKCRQNSDTVLHIDTYKTLMHADNTVPNFPVSTVTLPGSHSQKPVKAIPLQ
jgi:hypothetical protein